MPNRHEKGSHRLSGAPRGIPNCGLWIARTATYSTSPKNSGIWGKGSARGLGVVSLQRVCSATGVRELFTVCAVSLVWGLCACPSGGCEPVRAIRERMVTPRW
jgi:hypothetical protein